MPSPKLADTTKGCSLGAGGTAVLKLNDPGLLAHPLCMRQGLFRKAESFKEQRCLPLHPRVGTMGLKGSRHRPDAQVEATLASSVACPLLVAVLSSVSSFWVSVSSWIK